MIQCFPEYICSFFWCKIMEQVGNYRLHHQVKIPRCSNQQVEIIFHRSIFSELIWTNIIYHSKPQVNKGRSLIMLLNSFKSWIHLEFQRQYPQQNKSKIPIHIVFSYLSPIHQENTVQIPRGIPGRVEPAHCLKTKQSAFWKAQMTTGSFSVLGSWARVW